MSPKQSQLLLPLLTAIADAGGSLKAKAVAESVAEHIGLTPADRDRCERTPGGKRYNSFDRSIRWVQQLGKLRGLTANDGPGIWRLTETAEDKLENIRPGLAITIFENDNGVVLWATAEAVESKLADHSIDLVITSPPYNLQRAKEYDDHRLEARHIDWLLDRAAAWKRVLTETGSVILNLGDVWLPDSPTMSLYNERLLVQLVDSLGYHLIQRLVWENPSRLPSPAEYVTVRRIRVNPSTENLWWIAPTPNPKANNRNVLVPYSRHMQKTLARGTNEGIRPSGHVLSADSFRVDNGGAIHHNLIVAPNTASNSLYLRKCREAGISPHPARFPEAIPEFAMRLTTEPGDVVFDPFAGSCTTAAVAQRLGRNFVVCDRSRHYLDGGVLQLAP